MKQYKQILNYKIKENKYRLLLRHYLAKVETRLTVYNKRAYLN